MNEQVLEEAVAEACEQMRGHIRGHRSCRNCPTYHLDMEEVRKVLAKALEEAI